MPDPSQPTTVPGPARLRGCAAQARSWRTGDDVDAAEGLIALSRLVQAVHGRVAQDHGMTPVQARMVCVLVFGSRTMAELAQCLGVERATLTGLVDRAEQRGLVARAAVPGDRRARNVALTPEGSRAAAAFHADAVERLGGLLSPLPAGERDRFRRAIAAIIAGGPAGPVGDPAAPVGRGGGPR